MKRSAELTRKTPLRAKKPMSRSRAPKMSANRSPRMKSRGMKGSAPTAEQKRFWDLLACEIGCIASHKDGFFNPVVTIHHIDGRTKPDAHWLVLPLSAGNHQDGTGAPGRIAVHPYKARFEAQYGKQLELLRECIEILQGKGFAVPDGALRAAGFEVPAAICSGQTNGRVNGTAIPRRPYEFLRQ